MCQHMKAAGGGGDDEEPDVDQEARPQQRSTADRAAAVKHFQKTGTVLATTTRTHAPCGSTTMPRASDTRRGGSELRSRIRGLVCAMRCRGRPRAFTCTEFMRDMSIQKSDRVAHELADVCEAFKLFGEFDQLNLGSSAGVGKICRH